MCTAFASSETKLITGDELLVMGDIGPCELIDGRIVPMTPTGGEHGRIEVRLGRFLDSFVEAHGLGWVMVGEVGIYIRRNPDRIRAADIVFISKDRMNSPARGFLDIAPDLVVEIMSPDDRWQDVRQKLEEYFSIGVSQVWIVEPKNAAVLIYRSQTEMQKLTMSESLVAEGPLQGFSFAVASLFE